MRGPFFCLSKQYNLQALPMWFCGSGYKRQGLWNLLPQLKKAAVFPD